MKQGYFDYLPNIDYVSRTTDRSSNDEYIRVKNIFRRAKLREDLVNVSTLYDLYNIPGNVRPEQVAQKLYGDSKLDWVILITNNIINVQDDWPMEDYVFRKFLLDKYGSDENINKVHHYETALLQDGWERVIVPGGLIVDSDFNISALDSYTNNTETTFSPNVPLSRSGSVTVDDAGTVKNSSGSELIGSNVVAISNYEYELRINDAKRNIYTLKPEYVEVVVNDLRTIMSYEESSQYIDERNKQAYNPRLTGI